MPDARDAKTRLQELTQACGWGLPEYNLTDHGPSATPRFTAVCHVRGEKAGTGAGNRKKTAERAAAERALAHLESEGAARRVTASRQ